MNETLKRIKQNTDKYVRQLVIPRYIGNPGYVTQYSFLDVTQAVGHVQQSKGIKILNFVFFY